MGNESMGRDPFDDLFDNLSGDQVGKPVGNPVWLERIESLKSGALAAIALAIVAGAGNLINPAFMEIPTIALNRLLDISIATFSGFLFGITYRHLVGDGTDDHLQSGAIGAFALVRGLAQAELFWIYGATLWAVGIAIVESFVMFGVAALLLDLALEQQWIRRFGKSNAD
jgi:hypothetical protein